MRSGPQVLPAFGIPSCASIYQLVYGCIMKHSLNVLCQCCINMYLNNCVLNFCSKINVFEQLLVKSFILAFYLPMNYNQNV